MYKNKVASKPQNSLIAPSNCYCTIRIKKCSNCGCSCAVILTRRKKPRLYPEQSTPYWSIGCQGVIAFFKAL